jgi:enoyl-CoA hydratase
MMGYIGYQIQGREARVALARPEKRNALNRAMIEELLGLLAKLASDPSIDSIVIFGLGPDFCAGADLAEIKERADETKRADIKRANGLMDFIEACPKPVIAKMQGHALGGGLELALACHKRVSSKDGIFGFPEITLGFLPAWGGQTRLPKLIGRDLAARMIHGGIRVGAPKALEWGLVDEIGPK